MKQFYSFSYVPPLFEIISYSLRKYIINVVIKPSTNLKDLLYKKKGIKKNPIPNDETSGVHLIHFTEKVNQRELR